MNQNFYIKGLAVTDNTFPYKTGQTTSYATDDDGDLEFGRGASWTTLDDNNPHGNTTRFLDELGGTGFVAGLLVDWAHADHSTETVLMWSVANNGANVTMATALTNVAASTLGGFSDWVLPNINVMRTLENHEVSRGLNYAPFNESNNWRFWTGTTWNALNTYGVTLANRPFDVSAVLKTTSSNMRYYQVRVATFAEAGV